MQVKKSIWAGRHLAMWILSWFGLAHEFGGLISIIFILGVTTETSGFPKEQLVFHSSANANGTALYESFFDLPDEGEDPFNWVAILRANAIALRAADLNSQVLQGLSNLLYLLIREEASVVQLQNDMTRMEEFKKVVDFLLEHPGQLPSSDYELHEAEDGQFVRVSVGKN